MKEAAQLRLLEAVEPAVAELIRLSLNAESESVRLAAIKELFERTGLGDPKTVRIETLPDRTQIREWMNELRGRSDD